MKTVDKVEEMSKNLIHHIRNYIRIDSKDENALLNFFQPMTFLKKEVLIPQDSKCDSHFFVVKGCLRMYFIDEKGVEQTAQFAIENWWITDYYAFERQATTQFSIQALEKTDVLQINSKNQEKLLAKFPQLERYFRIIYQKAYAASQLKSKYMANFSREQFYRHFNSNFPEFTNRIPQHILASYLNMTPEYLSEIKKK